ncbi:hypothetical protein BG55_22610 [Erwinia mallotivora]|uniref:Uncharacterized protein n=1 Tax=Erwinia mallotivora TaxID=69222 RepID=A0A014NIH0_9GAMM|nr:hypothetical protein BG55_22610 [Erwinia mallotivora]
MAITVPKQSYATIAGRTRQPAWGENDNFVICRQRLRVEAGDCRSGGRRVKRQQKRPEIRPGFKTGRCG